MKSLLFVSALCMPWHFSWLVVSLVYCDLTCSSGQTYVKFVKKCGSSWASEESFKVYDGSTLLYTGSNFANSETRTIEQCLPSSTNNQYTVELIDSYGDSWYVGSYLSIFGRFGNVIFKNMLVDPNQESYPFSLYYGIDQDSTWKMASDIASTGWTEYSFSDSTWMDATLGSVTTSLVLSISVSSSWVSLKWLPMM